MPELPEVQSIVNSLSASVVGRRIEYAVLNRADFVTPNTLDFAGELRGRQIASIARRAKRVVFELDNANRFYIHLGMSGRLTISSRCCALAKHTHLILQLDDSNQIRLCDPRRFGGIFWMGTQDHEKSLGPEPFELPASQFSAALKKTRRAIKTALLDQSLIAGIGNIYADEALFEAKIDPRKRANRLSSQEVRALGAAIRRVLHRAIRHKGSTLRDYVDATGARGGFQKLHRVYGRGNLPCVRCKTKLKRLLLGGRSSVFCPVCQGKRKLRT